MKKYDLFRINILNRCAKSLVLKINKDEQGASIKIDFVARL